eukprot:Skav209078  [mRNA]  locus=scaffold207:207591:211020:- [translate_table: standard]
MGKDWSSRIFKPPQGGDGRNRDIFPLPTLQECEVEQLLSRSVVRRLHRRMHTQKRVNLAIHALNSMFFGEKRVPQVQDVTDIDSLPLCQQFALKNIIERVAELGPPPADASSSGALNALRAAGSSYTEPEPGVGSVVSMDLSSLSLPDGKTAGVSLADSLLGDVHDMVVDFESFMLEDADKWTYIESEMVHVPPYNDPLLSSKHGYLQFLKHLYDCGVLGFTSSCRGRVGAFTVSKKPKLVNGVEVKRQRLVLDCRQTNLLFKAPPLTELGSLSALSRISLDSNDQLWVAGADIKDCFYAVDCPAGMADFFCLQHDLALDEALHITGGLHSPCFDSGRICPCIKVLPMGFNWSFFLIQALHEQSVLKSINIERKDLVLDGHPPPSPNAHSCISMPYCDNIHSMSLDKEVCQRGCDDICETLSDLGFSIHEKTEASLQCQTLGGLIDGEKGIVRPTPQRTWRVILAFQYLLSAKVSYKLVQRLLGHAMTVCVLNRCGMPIFRKLYDFVESQSEPRKLFNSELAEVRNFIGILPLLVADMKRPWSEVMTATDASPDGFGIVETTVLPGEAQRIGAWSERFRFKRLPVEEWAPRKRALPKDVFGDVSAVLGDPGSGIYDDFVENRDFPEVTGALLHEERWHTVKMGKWADKGDSITIKEGRALVIALRRLARSSQRRNKNHVILLDNLALCFSVAKGRPSLVKKSPQLLKGHVSQARKLAPRESRSLQAPKNSVRTKKKMKDARVLIQKDKPLPAKPKDLRSVRGVKKIEVDKEDRVKMSKLEMKSVSQEVQNQYAGYFNKFKGFCRENALQWPLKGDIVDDVMCDYLDWLYEEGRSPHEGEKSIAAMEFFRMELKGTLNRCRRALKGWRKIMPPQSRLPLPRILMFGIAMDLLARGKRDMALMTVLAFDCYLRPGEALDLKGKNIVAPVLQAGKQFKWVTVVVREAEGRKPDKTGVYDNSIPIDKNQLQWLGRELLTTKRNLNSVEDLLFSFTMEEYRTEFARSGKKMNIEVLHPYQLRHGGATEDLSTRYRDHNAVKSRGRWRTDSSVRRYAKIGRVQELLNRLGPLQISYCKWAEASMMKCLQGITPPRQA